MELQVVTYVERPDLDERWDDTVGPAWPEFLMHDATVNELWHHLYEIAPESQFFVIDRDSDAVVCVGNSIPFRWDGDPANLPDGIDGVLPLAIKQHKTGVAPNTLCALQAVVVAAYQGQGHAPVPLRAMADAARRAALRRPRRACSSLLETSLPVDPDGSIRDVVPTGWPSVRSVVPRARSSGSVVPSGM